MNTRRHTCLSAVDLISASNFPMFKITDLQGVILEGAEKVLKRGENIYLCAAISNYVSSNNLGIRSKDGERLRVKIMNALNGNLVLSSYIREKSKDGERLRVKIMNALNGNLVLSSYIREKSRGSENVENLLTSAPLRLRWIKLLLQHNGYRS